jgi:NAD(P)H-flavin reductase
MKEELKIAWFRTGFRFRAHAKPPTEHEKRRFRRIDNSLDYLALAAALAVLWSISQKNLVADTEVFDMPRFTPFVIISKDEVSPTSFILTIRPKRFTEHTSSTQSDPYAKQWQKGTWSVEFKQPQLQIARSYTPLPPRQNDKPGDLRFLIREETNGEMSQYLAGLAAGDKIELRGPHTELELPAQVTDVLFLAGGTGIAPAFQVAYTLLEARKESPLPNIHIIWANRRREDCLGGTNVHYSDTIKKVEGIVVQELRELQEKYPDNVKVDYVVDEEGTFVDQEVISRATRSYPVLTHQAVTSRIDSKLLFVSGPEGFINFLAGPKNYWGGKLVQGELGGLIGKMGIRDWKVWKQ